MTEFIKIFVIQLTFQNLPHFPFTYGSTLHKRGRENHYLFTSVTLHIPGVEYSECALPQVKYSHPSPAIPQLVCTLQSPGTLVNIPRPRAHPRLIKSNSRANTSIGILCDPPSNDSSAQTSYPYNQYFIKIRLK